MISKAKLCPRCQRAEFTPYTARFDAPAGDPLPPALSRLDDETEICTNCGLDEALRDLDGQPPIPPDEWPI